MSVHVASGLALGVLVVLVAFTQLVAIVLRRRAERTRYRYPGNPVRWRDGARMRSGLWLLLLPLLLGCGLPSELVAELRQDRDDWRVVARDSSSPEARRVAEAAADQVSTILFETGEEKELEPGARARREARRVHCPSDEPTMLGPGWCWIVPASGWTWPGGWVAYASPLVDSTDRAARW